MLSLNVTLATKTSMGHKIIRAANAWNSSVMAATILNFHAMNWFTVLNVGKNIAMSAFHG